MALADRSNPDPVVISGLGIVSPLGGDRESTWAALLAGKRAGQWLSGHDLSAIPPCAIPPCAGARWSGNPAILRSESQWTENIADRVTRLGVLAASEAWNDAGLTDVSVDPARMACIVGTSKGGLHTYDAALNGVHPTMDWRDGWPSSTASYLAARFNLRGPCLAPVAACATGVVAILRGVAAIESDECDLVLTGSADDSLHAGVLSSFQRLGVLAHDPEPTRACRPYDRDRSGFVVGAGAGCLVLERRSHAERRGVRWYAEIIGGRLATDPAGMTQLDTAGQALGRLIEMTCAGVRPDYIQLHGTGTRLNDPAECRAVRQVFDADADGILHSSVKGAIGHLLGAAGSVETALACLSLRDQTVPACANLENVDPECALPFVQGAAAKKPIRTVLKLSLGFGGHQAAILLRRPG